MAADEQSPEAESATFEQAMRQLHEIVRGLEEGNQSLDDSLRKYELGIQFLNQCQRKLAEAEQKIELLSGFDADGNPLTQPFAHEDLTLQQKADSRSRRRTARLNASSATPVALRPDESSPEPDQGDVDLGGTLF